MCLAPCVLYRRLLLLLPGAAHCWVEGVSCGGSQEGAEATASKQEGLWQQQLTQ
jgi:hypothetical protein